LFEDGHLVQALSLNPVFVPDLPERKVVVFVPSYYEQVVDLSLPE
jgi:hypothetical protein